MKSAIALLKHEGFISYISSLDWGWKDPWTILLLTRRRITQSPDVFKKSKTLSRNKGAKKKSVECRDLAYTGENTEKGLGRDGERESGGKKRAKQRGKGRKKNSKEAEDDKAKPKYPQELFSLSVFAWSTSFSRYRALPVCSSFFFLRLFLVLFSFGFRCPLSLSQY